MPRNLAALGLALCLFLVTFAVNLQAPLYGAYAAQSDVGATAVTIAFAAYVAGLMPTLLCLGGISDRVGRRGPIIVALSLAAAATALLTIWPHWSSLIIARVMLGAGTGLATTTGAAFMPQIMGAGHAKSAALAVTSATSLGFGGGALATGISLGLQGPTLFPASFLILFILTPCLMVAALCLPRTPRDANAPVLRPPIFPQGSWIFGIALALAWSATGMTIAVVPLELARKGLGGWAGLVVFLAIFTGFLCQPLARRLSNRDAMLLGCLLVPGGFGVLLLGMYLGSLTAVLAGTCITSAASYGFTYLAALAEVCARAPSDRARATAGLFLYAYCGFSLPVIASGVLADAWGLLPAMTAFCVAIIALTGAALTWWRYRTAQPRIETPTGRKAARP